MVKGGDGLLPPKLKRNPQRMHLMKTFSLTRVALVVAAASALIVSAGSPNILVSPRAAQAQQTVVSGVSGDRDYVHGAPVVGSPRGLAFAADFRRTPGTDSGPVSMVAASTVSPRAVSTFPWLKNDTKVYETPAFASCKTATKGECKMSCCSTATACAMPCCKS